MRITLSVTMPGHRHHYYTIWEYNGSDIPAQLSEHAVVDASQSQNGIRRMIAVINQFTAGGYQNFYDFAITYEPRLKEYRLWVYERNWQGRAAYYAGMVHVRNVQRRIRQAA